jgi:hypothetical protein
VPHAIVGQEIVEGGEVALLKCFVALPNDFNILFCSHRVLLLSVFHLEPKTLTPTSLGE